MAAPKFITGGMGENIFRSANERAGEPTGVFSDTPGATLKYALNNGARDAENRETMARLFVEIPHSLRQDFLNTVPRHSKSVARRLFTSQRENGSLTGTGFVDFLLTGAQEQFAERAQVVDTLTDNFVAFYSGAQPPVFQYSGTVLNTYQDDQRVWMLRLYNEILRGTKLATRGLICRLRYDSLIVSGYMEGLSMSLSGAVEMAADFSFALRVKRLTVIGRTFAQPTQLSTVATTSSLLNGDRIAGLLERGGLIMPDSPDNPTSSPSTASVEPDSSEARSFDPTMYADAEAGGVLYSEVRDAADAAGVPYTGSDGTSSVVYNTTVRLQNENPNTTNSSSDAASGLSNVSADTATSEALYSAVNTSSDALTSQPLSSSPDTQVATVTSQPLSSSPDTQVDVVSTNRSRGRE